MINISEKEFKKLFKEEKKEKKHLNHNIHTATQLLRRKERWSFKEICIKSILVLGVIYFIFIISYLSWVFFF